NSMPTMDKSRREVLTGAAAVVAAAAVPLPTIAAPVVPEPVALAPAVRPLWPTETQAQRQGCIVRTLIEHIAETGNKAKGAVTTDDIFAFCRFYGMSWDEVLCAQEYCAEMEAMEAREALH